MHFARPPTHPFTPKADQTEHPKPVKTTSCMKQSFSPHLPPPRSLALLWPLQPSERNYNSLQSLHPHFASCRDYSQTAVEDNLSPMGVLSPFNTPNPWKPQVWLKSNKKGSLIKRGSKICILKFKLEKPAEKTQSSHAFNPREDLAVLVSAPTAAQMLFLGCTPHLSK